ncbi:MAG TPA: serine/threonine-protein kinase [Rhodanobacteraceae bacterium]
MRTRLGHYDIVAELGRGGMGVVYKGHESSLNRYVAIKVLADSLAHDEAVKERFLREARSMAALNDPHIIQIYFIGDDEGQTYFVMEFVEGESLGSMLKREGKLSVEQSAKVIQQTAMGLATAHDRGVVHRDIKPGNLMITSRGTVKIADFGIALSNHDLSKKLTTTGEFVGTPGYLSPEVCLGKPVDQRSDIFSLGIVMFEMLTGRMPFTDESPLGLMLEVVKAEIPDVREMNAEVDPEIARILDKMIAKDPAERYQNCHDLVADLNAHPLVAKGGPITLKPKISTAAQTMLGQKTPVSGQTSLPSTPRTPSAMPAQVAQTRITPSGLPAAPPVAAAAPPHQSVLDRSQSSQPRSSVVPWAIAAILAVSLAGGAYAFRDRIGAAFSSPANNSTASAATSTPGTTPAPAAPPASQIAANAPNPNPVQTATTDPAQSAPNAPAVPTPPASPTAVAAEPTPGTNAPPPAATGDAAADASGAPAARASQAGVDALRDLPAAQAAQNAPAPRIANASVPEKPAAPPKPHVPTIAVVASGDEVITSPAQDALVSLLQSRGFRVIEGGAMHGDRPNLGAMSGRADAVVFVNARPVGSQEIAYYGQSSTLYTVQLSAKAYRVSDGSVMWSSGQEQVNFTTLNAAEKAREAIQPMLDTVDSRLAEFRSRGNRG